MRKSGAVEATRLDAYLDRVPPAQLAGGPAALAEALVRDGVITWFHSAQFLKGKSRGFTLGTYRILEPIGRGGMASVFLCEHVSMRRRAAIKVLPSKSAQHVELVKRFYREARAAAALDHPNIVRTFDVDHHENVHFLVMEYVEGTQLQEVVGDEGPLDVTRAAGLIRQAALGLNHAHANSMVHRDIKPSNLIVDRNGTLKILDMGLARIFDESEEVLTKGVLGTPDYIAPEQIKDSHQIDHRADIYSLGSTFYFTLTGSQPFPEGTIAQKLVWHQTRPPKAIRFLRPEVPEGLAAIVDKMMAKAPDQRYQTAAEVADALAPWANPQGSAPAQAPPPPEAPEDKEETVTDLAAMPTLPAAALAPAKAPVVSSRKGSIRRPKTKAAQPTPRPPVPAPKSFDRSARTRQPDKASRAAPPAPRPRAKWWIWLVVAALLLLGFGGMVVLALFASSR